MNPILDMLMNAAGGGALQQVGQRFGLSNEQTSRAFGQLVPALLGGVQQNASKEGGIEALLGALGTGNHGQYLDNPELLGQESTTQDGNSILGHIFGSKDVSRAVATRAAEQTGIGVDVLKQLLPVVTTMVMARLSKQNAGAPTGENLAGGRGLLSSLLDQHRDGAVADDIAGMLDRFLGVR